MPHLAPLSWLLAPVIFWSVLVSIMVFFWWAQLPKLPAPSTYNPSLASHLSKWNWS
uniref:ATP synthase F0 subunit 8 n=1 Tax=Pharyngocirrus uchidai TaxID=2498818 RepID=A0A7G9IX08_9ANNE|nr:ATP synthase F0 subunit 8 [Pharyngocirrus uchidai]QNM39902.1 ATP synthase F0 subunit 8 [Pharyngocirrus uchidai]